MTTSLGRRPEFQQAAGFFETNQIRDDIGENVHLAGAANLSELSNETLSNLEGLTEGNIGTVIPDELCDLRILVVDDDLTLVMYTCAILRGFGLSNLEGITDSKNAVKSVQVDRPDLILLDLHMPGRDGFEVMRDIHQVLSPDEYLPILVVTSDDDEVTQRRAYREGAADFLLKPIRPAELVLRARTLLRARWHHLQLKTRNEELDREIRAQRQLAENLAATSVRLSALLSNFQAGVLVEDECRRIVLANQTFCDWFRITASPQELVGADYLQVEERFHAYSDPRAAVARIWQILANRVPVTNEIVNLADRRVFERDYIPIFRNGRYDGHLWAYRDITQRKIFERELAEARDSALQSARLKAEFLANMSHEIRTPINGVIGMMGLLGDSELDLDQRELLRTAQKSADSLLNIINDVLDFSKIEAGKFTIEESVVSPRVLMDDCLDMVSRHAREKGLRLTGTLSPGVPAAIRADGARVQQVLLNLLSNAVKFTNQGEVVARIEVNPGGLHFSVTDTGCGISKLNAARLFQPFTQVDGSVTRAYQGTGLGLAISRQLVELMNGEIGLESAPGAGSKFWFTIPLVAAEIETADPAWSSGKRKSAVASAGLNFAGRKVLIADDNAINREVVLRWLGKWGCTTMPAVNGREALELVRREDFDLVLMDCQMPEMDGYAASTAIRALQGPKRQIPIIAVTAHALEGDRQKCIDAGMDDYITKPIKPEELAAAIERWSDRIVDTHSALAPPSPGMEHPGEAPTPVVILDLAVLDELRDVLGDDGMISLVEMFQEQSEEFEAGFGLAIGARDAERLARISHTLKGVARQFGAEAVAVTCQSLERQASAGDFEEATREFAKLRVQLAAALSGLRAYITPV